MYTLLKPLKVREMLLERNIRIFTATEFVRIFHTSSYVTKYFLETQVNEGLLLRLKQGIYTLKTDSPFEEEIANAIYKPSYISFEYALAHYHILPEMPYTVTSATTKPTRLLTAVNVSFSYRTIKKEAYTGYSLRKQNGQSFLIAEKEKAIVDYLYFVTLQKIPGSERLLESLEDKEYYRFYGLSKDKINEYIKTYANERLANFVASFI